MSRLESTVAIKYGIYINAESATSALSRLANRVTQAIVVNIDGGASILVQAGKELELPAGIQANLLPAEDVVVYFDIYRVDGISAFEFIKRLMNDGRYRYTFDSLMLQLPIILLRMWRRKG